MSYGGDPTVKKAPGRKRVRGRGRPETMSSHLCVEPLEGRWLPSGAPLTSSLNAPIDARSAFTSSLSPHFSAVDGTSPQLAHSPAHSGLVRLGEELVRGERPTQSASLKQSESSDSGGQFVPAIEFPLSGSDRGAIFSVGAVDAVNNAALDAAFTNFGERPDLLSLLDIRLYGIRSRDFSPSGSEFANNAEEGPTFVRDFFLMRAETALSAEGSSSPLARAYFGARGAMASDFQELAAFTSGTVSMGTQEGRIPVVELKTFVFVGTSRGWIDSSQGLSNFGWQGLSLGSSAGPTAGTLASFNVAYRGSPFLATVDWAPADVVTSDDPELPEDTSLALASLNTIRQEWSTWAPQVAPLLTEGVSMGVTALELGMRALAEPILDATGPPHNVLYWVGISSWLLAGALACEAVRRRLPQLQTYELSVFGGPPDPLRGDRT